MYNLEILEKGCEELGITLSDTQKNQFIRFYEYLVEKNKVMNLTGITEFDEVLVKHFLDSLCCVKAVDTEEQKNMQKTKPTEKNMISAYPEQYPDLQPCLNTVSRM